MKESSPASTDIERRPSSRRGKTTPTVAATHLPLPAVIFTVPCGHGLSARSPLRFGVAAGIIVRSLGIIRPATAKVASKAATSTTARSSCRARKPPHGRRGRGRPGRSARLTSGTKRLTAMGSAYAGEVSTDQPSSGVAHVGCSD